MLRPPLALVPLPATTTISMHMHSPPQAKAEDMVRQAAAAGAQVILLQVRCAHTTTHCSCRVPQYHTLQL